MQEIKRSSFLVSAQYGQIDYVSSDGELLMSVAVPPGRVSAREYLDLAPPGATLEIADGIAVVNPRGGYGVQSYGAGSHDSGANPDFAPTSASRMEREMRVTLNQMKSATKRLEAREKALAKIERIPTAPSAKPEPAPVLVEPVTPNE